MGGPRFFDEVRRRRRCRERQRQKRAGMNARFRTNTMRTATRVGGLTLCGEVRWRRRHRKPQRDQRGWQPQAARRRSYALRRRSAKAALPKRDDASRQPLLRRLTFEVTWRRRRDARPGLRKMYSVPAARAWWHAVGSQVDRVVSLRRRAERGVHCSGAAKELSVRGRMYPPPLT